MWQSRRAGRCISSSLRANSRTANPLRAHAHAAPVQAACVLPLAQKRGFASSNSQNATNIDASQPVPPLSSPLDPSAMTPGALESATAAANSSGDASTVVQGIQHVIESIHEVSGLPWWATFMCGGIALRATMFPLYVFQMRATQRLVQAKGDFQKLYSAYKYARTFHNPHDAKGHLDAIILGRKGIKAVMAKYNTRPVQTVVGTFMNIPVFMLVAYSAREMIRSGLVPGLEAGGFSWCMDLTQPDDYYILPFIACGSTYLNIELSLVQREGVMKSVGRFAQAFPLLALPLASMLPQGVFFYWIGSSWASMAQTLVMRNNTFRRKLGLRPRAVQEEDSPLRRHEVAIKKKMEDDVVR